MSKLDFKGESVTLEAMLNARVNRAATQRRLLKQDSESSLLSVTMNIPGPIKTNQEINSIFLSMIKAVETLFPEGDFITKTYQDLPTGPECYLLVRGNIIKLKKRMIQLEEIHPHGRLMDIDVLYMKDEQLHVVSRTDLGFEPRSCFICRQNAKICGRMGQHSQNELIQATYQLIQKGKIK